MQEFGIEFYVRLTSAVPVDVSRFAATSCGSMMSSIEDRLSFAAVAETCAPPVCVCSGGVIRGARIRIGAQRQAAGPLFGMVEPDGIEPTTSTMPL